MASLERIRQLGLTRHRSFEVVLSKARAGTDVSGDPLTSIAGNDRVWLCDTTSGEGIAHGTTVNRGALNHDDG